MNTFKNLWNKGKKLVAGAAALVAGGVAVAEPAAPIESVVTELTGAASDLGTHGVTVIAAAIGLFTLLFGVRYLKKALTRTA